jgi:transcriptional regulator with XRE-family HTH domain
MPVPERRPAAAPTAESALSKAVLRAAESLGINGAQLGRVLGVSESSVSRLASGARLIDPRSKEGELALLLVRVYRSLDALVGGAAEQRDAWLRSRNRALNGVPAEMLAQAEGLVAVVRYLDGMRAPA